MFSSKDIINVTILSWCEHHYSFLSSLVQILWLIKNIWCGSLHNNGIALALNSTTNETVLRKYWQKKSVIVLMCMALPCLSPYRRTYAQCCNVCYPLFLFIILAACVMACAGLVWMQIALKEDLDALKEKLQSSKLAVSHTHLMTVIKSLIILDFIATVVF